MYYFVNTTVTDAFGGASGPPFAQTWTTTVPPLVNPLSVNVNAFVVSFLTSDPLR